jgi:WD40 repeat protein
MLLLALAAAGALADFRDPPGLVARIGPETFHHRRYASLLGMSADGRRLVTAEPAPLNHANASLFVWDAATGKLRATHPLGRDGSAILAIGLGPEGVRVFERVEGGWHYQLRVVDPETGSTVRTGAAWKEPPQRDFVGGFEHGWFSFGADGAWMIRPANSGYSLFDTTTGDETVIDLGQKPVPFGGEYLFDARGRLFATPDGKGGVRLFELPGGKRPGDVANPGDEQHAVAFTPNGKELLLWARKGETWSLDAWHVAEKQRRTVLAGRSLPGRVHFAPDGKRFALVPGSRGSHYPAGDWEVRDFATARVLGRVPAGASASRPVFNPDGRTLYTQPGHMVVPWDVATGKPAPNAPTVLGPIDRFRFTPDGKLVGVAGGFVTTWDPAIGKELARERIPRLIDHYGAVAFSPGADRLHFTGPGDTLVAWDFRAGTVRESPLELRRFPNTAVEHWFTPDGSLHVEHRDSDAALILRDPATGKETARVAVPEEWRQLRRGGGVHGLALSPDGRRLAIGGERPSDLGDRNVPPSLLAVLNLDGSTQPVICESAARVRAVVFSPDGRFMVGTLREDEHAELGVWNALTGRRVAAVRLGTGRVNALKFSPDGRTLAVSLGRHDVRLVETASWRVRARVPVPGWESHGHFGPDRYRDLLAWSPDGRRLATALPDGGLTVWDVRKLGSVKPLDKAASAERTWDSLAGSDAASAYAAVQAMAEAPDRAIPLLRARLAPAPAPDAAKLKGLIAGLGSDEFADRERAAAELGKLGRLAEPALRDALRATPSPEVSRRAGELLERLAAARPTADEILAVRAVETAEWIATPEATKLLESWAAGAEGARLTAEAKAALGRLTR